MDRTDSFNVADHKTPEGETRLAVQHAAGMLELTPEGAENLVEELQDKLEELEK